MSVGWSISSGCQNISKISVFPSVAKRIRALVISAVGGVPGA